MEAGVAVGGLVDERRRHGETTRGVALQAVTTSDRVRSYLVSAGAVRGEDETLSFGRRVIDDRFVLAELGGDDTATLCYLGETGTLLVDRGGRLLENEYVAALIGGYYAYHGGDFELHVQPLTLSEAREARDALSAIGSIEGEGEGPFGEPLTRMSEALEARV